MCVLKRESLILGDLMVSCDPRHIVYVITGNLLKITEFFSYKTLFRLIELKTNPRRHS